jgi:hypothetical protein
MKVMTPLADRPAAAWRLMVRSLIFGGLLCIAAGAIFVAIHGFSTAGASVLFAVVAMVVGVVALNLMLALLDQWLGR